MHSVSQKWKDAQNQNFVPESFVEITMNVGDPESQAAASPSDNGQEVFSNSSMLAAETEKTPVRYATLERDLWRLDGSFKLLTDSGPYGEQGYIGNALCDENGVFRGVLPTITISFGRVFENMIPGITVIWATAYDEYATKFRITAFAEGVETYRKEFENANMTTAASADIDYYDTIVIEVLEWCKGRRRARIERILVGIEKAYTKAKLMEYKHSMSVDPLSAALPKSEIVFKVSNVDGEYNPDNPRGAEKYLMERQSIEVRYGFKIDGKTEWIPAGTFFMSEWETPQNGITATFTARDALEYMNDLYAGPLTGTLAEIATAALAQAGLPKLSDGTDRWEIDSSLSGLPAADGAELNKCSIAEVLQYVAHAACCVFYQDRTGVVRIEPLSPGETDYKIGRFTSYQNSEISLTKQLKSVDVNMGQCVLPVSDVGETQPVENPLITADRAPIVAQWTADYLKNRKILSGDFRADPRLDALDRIINENKFSQTVVLVTDVEFSYNGAFRGSYEGRAGV